MDGVGGGEAHVTTCGSRDITNLLEVDGTSPERLAPAIRDHLLHAALEHPECRATWTSGRASGAHALRGPGYRAAMDVARPQAAIPTDTNASVHCRTGFNEGALGMMEEAVKRL
ncbi:hypothetical protein SLS62_006977 [Diatrype stigma]|uniref:Uncharacterized protein n=1 Tax=Diatrype stigma TaxID=117547 RepID=A0AAN9UPY8_9PEZI